MKKLLLMMLLISLGWITRATAKTITGTVYDAADKKPIPGAAVRVTGTAAAAITDPNGKYNINVADNTKELTFAFIGYQTETVKIKGKTQIDVYLKPSSHALNEVVVMGYGTQKRVSVTGSVASVAPSALQERARGVVVTNSPGSSKDIRIRGTNSTAIYGYAAPASPNYSENESYKTINENGFFSPRDNPLSTFSVDVDAGSYSNVRRFINNGQLPPPDAVRIEELINYFSYNLAPPINGSPVAIHTELSAAPWNKHHQLLRVGLKAKMMNAEKLPPSNLVFLIDVSGSMNEPNKLPLVKSSLKLLVDQLRAKDKVAIVVYAGRAGLVLPSTPGDDKMRIKEAIEDLSAGGSTAGGQGIKLAYKIAAENFIKGGNNRVILSTDGDFNVGVSSDEELGKLIEQERQSDVFLSALGFGMGNYKDSKMEELADKGNGNYAYIDNITEARKTLVSEFGGTLFTVAKDVKLQVEFNPAKVQAYRLLGYEDRLLSKEDFNNDQKDAGDMGVGHNVTALYEVVPVGVKDDFSLSVDPLKYQKPVKISVSGSAEVCTIKFRYKEPDGTKSKLEQTTVNDLSVNLNSASTDFRFAAAVAELGMLLRNSQYKQQSTYEQVINLAKGAKGEDAEGYRAEFIRLAESAKLLAKSELVTKY